jgi:hypothetical protein
VDGFWNGSSSSSNDDDDDTISIFFCFAPNTLWLSVLGARLATRRVGGRGGGG